VAIAYTDEFNNYIPAASRIKIIDAIHQRRRPAFVELLLLSGAS